MINLGLICLISLTQFSCFQEILVPYNHLLPDSRKIEIKVEFLNEFDSEKETVFLLEDAFDDIYLPFYELLDFSESSNFVLIKGRKDNEELKSGVMHTGKPDYQLAYRLYNQDQVARDIEVIRKELLGEKEVILLGYSSSAMVLQHYLSLYPEQVSRMISVNPLVFDIQKNLSFPKNEISFLGFQLNQKQLFDFNYYSNFERYNLTKEQLKTLSENSLIQVLSYRDLLSGVSHKQDIENDIPLLVRVFEQAIAFSGMQGDSQTNPNFQLLRELSSPIWERYEESHFPFYGTNYDQILNFQGKLILIAGAYDQLIFPKSYDVLAELYSNSTLLLLKDGHALQRVSSQGLLSEVVDSFIQNDFDSKVKVYKKLVESNLIFEKYREGEFGIYHPL